MEFKGRGAPLTPTGIEAACDVLGVGAPELWAVMRVETQGCGFLPDRRPKMRFEPHWFSRLTGGRFGTIEAETGDGEAEGAAAFRRLSAAMKRDRVAALKSASWGLGQIMGFNAARAGYADVGALVAAFVDGEDAQVRAMATYIAAGEEAKALRARRWADFAARYNGPDYARNRYDEKLAAAHAALSAGRLPDLRLRTAQLYLTYLGYDPKGVDGVMGRNTRAALLAFQAAEFLPQTGMLDDPTERRLRAMAE